MAAVVGRGSESGSDDEDGLFMADFFTKDLDIEDDFKYSYGAAVTVTLRGVSREFGQTTLGKGDGTGLTIWRGAEELCRYLWSRSQAAGCLVSGKRVLELGAGLGLVGLVVGHLGARCNVVTDGDEATCDRIAANAARNGLFLTAAKATVGGDCDGTLAATPAAATTAAGSRDWSSTARHFCRPPLSPPPSPPLAAVTAAPGPIAVMSVARLLWCDPADMARARKLAATNDAPVSAAAREATTCAASPGDDTSGSGVGDGGQGGGDAGCYDLILAADVVYDVCAVVPLVATVAALLSHRPGSRWLLSFARRNVPVHLVIEEAARAGLVCQKVEGFQCATSGENIFELRWRAEVAGSPTPDHK